MDGLKLIMVIRCKRVAIHYDACHIIPFIRRNQKVDIFTARESIIFTSCIDLTLFNILNINLIYISCNFQLQENKMMDVLKRISIQHSGIYTIAHHSPYAIAVIRPHCRKRCVAATFHLADHILQDVAILTHLPAHSVSVRSVCQLQHQIRMN